MVLPKGAAWPRRAAVTVAFGRPVHIVADTSPQEIARLLHHHVSIFSRSPNL